MANYPFSYILTLSPLIFSSLLLSVSPSHLHSVSLLSVSLYVSLIRGPRKAGEAVPESLPWMPNNFWESLSALGEKRNTRGRKKETRDNAVCVCVYEVCVERCVHV